MTTDHQLNRSVMLSKYSTSMYVLLYLKHCTSVVTSKIRTYQIILVYLR